ncbi:Predicted nuclease of the RNAse H fold, HicB family [Pilibacter termitis]|uniref:Predicted nuclease of the RNAse H fold, HicB family n=1 Tax=Pilibacter termitis TaxID=263852 RepID=A0A1T4PDB3_9ENTE|nr:type II toxin-antitoxin system HicB family antitoxin [Pilibacter termitis]SJZ89553.1 Predicted nuclease of the RNAse H fold, HicB family [Pilibacter termitis]
MFVSYPALFYYEEAKEGYPEGFSVFFPDFENCGGTQGDTISEAIYNAADWLGLVLSDDIENNREMPNPTPINLLDLEKNNPFKDDDFDYEYNKEKSFISMVSVELSEYLKDSEPVKKTLTIPKWADKLGKELHLNFSQTLTDAIVYKKTHV